MNVLKAKVTYNDNAEIFVYDMLYMNCQISISSKPVKVNFDFKEVVITPKKRKNEYVQSIPDYLEYKEHIKKNLKKGA